MNVLTEGKHWPADYIKTGINMVKSSDLGKQSWYSDPYIQQDIKTIADEFGPLSHKNSNLGFFSTIIRWFIEYSGTSKQKYQEFIERKLDDIIGTLQTILSDPSYDKVKDDIKQKWTFAQFEDLQKRINNKAKASSEQKLKNIVKRDDYELIPIYSYEELNEKFGGSWTGYKGQSEWCHTNGKSTYESWTKNGTQMFFVLAKKDWQKVFQPEYKPTGKDYNAYDAYGLSLIAILVDVATGNLLNETLRWNHVIEPSYTNPGATVDKAFKNNWGELSQAVGMDAKSEVKKFIKDIQDELKKKVEKANAEAARILKNAKTVTNGILPKDILNIVTHIDIPDGVESIGDGAFYNCSGLKNVMIPNGVTSIESYAFYNCTNLTSMTIPDSVKSIGYQAFYNCHSLTNMMIPNSVTRIGDYAFYKCSSLTSVTIPDSVTSIGSYAFSGCIGLTSVIIPNSVTSIGTEAFSYCIGLTSVMIPNSVTIIRDWSFADCRGLISVMIPDNVTSIGEDAFSDCSNLKSLIFKVKTMDEVRAMKNYPWGIEDESIIKVENTIDESLHHDKQVHFWAHMLDDAFVK